MTGGRGRSTARQDEFFQRRQRIVESVEGFLEPRGVLGRDDLVSWNAQLTTHVEQLVLDLGQRCGHLGRQPRNGEQHAECAVELVYGAIRLDALAVLRHARAISEAGGTVVTGAR